MKINKSGISLIVLVITIIVLAILAATVIISIVNSGLIDSSKNSVDAYKLGQVRDIASAAWSEALIDMNISTTEEYTNYILQFLKDSGYTESELDKYTIVANENGVTVNLRDTMEDENAEVTLTLDKTKIEKEIGSSSNTEILTATLTNASGNLVWSTSDATVVTVEGNNNIGTVTVVGAGTATITVKYGENIAATCEVSITEKVNVSLITFTIAGVEYQAEEGMTWRQWCENPLYNVGNKFSIGMVTVVNPGAGAEFIELETVICEESYVICIHSLYPVKPDSLCGECGYEASHEYCEFDLDVE